jgi:hypothetical protein
MKKVNAWILTTVLLAACAQTAKSAAAEPDIDIWKAAASGNMEAIKQHLKAGTDIDTKESPGGSTPLLVAATFGQVEAAKFLIGKGANVNAGSNDGATALHGAAFFCHAEIVTLPLHAGGQVHREGVDECKCRLPVSPLRGDTEIGGRVVCGTARSETVAEKGAVGMTMKTNC